MNIPSLLLGEVYLGLKTKGIISSVISGLTFSLKLLGKLSIVNIRGGELSVLRSYYDRADRDEGN